MPNLDSVLSEKGLVSDVEKIILKHELHGDISKK